MKPGAAFQIFEQDLAFPGAIRQPDSPDNKSEFSVDDSSDEEDTDVETPTEPSPQSSGRVAEPEIFIPPHTRPRAYSQTAAARNARSDSRPRSSSEAQPPPPIPSPPSRPSRPSTANTSSRPSTANKSSSRPSSVKTGRARSRIRLNPGAPNSAATAYLVEALDQLGSSDTSLDYGSRKSMSRESVPMSRSSTKEEIPLPPIQTSGFQNGEMTPKGFVRSSPYRLVRTVEKAPENPRDHTLLEHIYNEMHASRFINLAPLALLANLLDTYFKGKLVLSVISHV